jgi:hypothetical protein
MMDLLYAAIIEIKHDDSPFVFQIVLSLSLEAWKLLTDYYLATSSIVASAVLLTKLLRYLVEFIALCALQKCV